MTPRVPGISKLISLSPINIGLIKSSLTASITDSIGRGFPALTIPATTPFFLCATFKNIQNGPKREIIGDESLEQEWTWIDRNKNEDE